MECITHRRHTRNMSNPERWASMIAGGALTLWGLKRRKKAGWAMAALGGGFIRCGATGYCFLYKALGVRTAKGQGAQVSVPYELGIRVDKSITVNRPVEEVYRFWRNLENLPRFMNHLQSVRPMDEKRSHWVAKGPGKNVEWDAEIINDIPNELMGWRSLAGSDVDNAGSVHFKMTPDGQGTEVKVELQYNPPGGTVGALFAKLFGEDPSQQIQEDLRRFKQILETGEIPTVEGQSSARETRRESEAKKDRFNEVQHASELSFPASDSPAYSR